MRLVRFTLLAMLLLCSAITAPLMGQTAPLDEKQKAVVVFDLRLDLLMGSELAKSLKLQEQFDKMAAQQGGNGPDPSTIAGLFGAMSAPENMEAAQGFNGGELPIEFFVKIKFKDASAATAAMEKLLESDPTAFERNGKTYYRPKEDGAPENAVVHQFDATTLEFGTDAFVFHPNQKVLTEALSAAWTKMPEKEAVRIAIDMAGASSLLAEAVEFGKQAADPTSAGFLELVDNMKNLRLSVDLSGANLITLNSTGVDSEQAEELQGGLDALLGMAKMAGTMQVNQLKQQDPAMSGILETVLKSLEAKVDGDEVSVVIPKPAGFDDAVKNFAEKMGLGEQ